MESLVDAGTYCRLSFIYQYRVIYSGGIVAVDDGRRLPTSCVICRRLPAEVRICYYSCPKTYPEFIEERQITNFIASLREEIADVGQSVLSTLLVSIQGFITVLVYLVLVPLLVFFFLKDKDLLLGWVAKLLPRKENRALTTQVWQEANQKVSNYIRGKLLEIFDSLGWFRG